MKLLSLTNRYYFAFIIIIVIIGGYGTYQILKSSLNNQFNRKLLAEKEQFILELHQYRDLKEIYFLNIGDKITLEPISNSIEVATVLSDTLVYDGQQQVEVSYRFITFSEAVDGQNYLITIGKSLLSTDELIRIIEEAMFILTFTIIVSLILISNRISQKLWLPFYQLLNFLGDYDIKNPKKPQFKDTNIEEFQRLNETVEQMIEKSISDYENLKEFSENASHEIQTPLAIIKSKSELLMQDGTLSECHVQDISKIYTAANRLSHLNHDLAFLTKIDNNEFITHKSISLKQFIQNKLSQLEDLIRLKKLKVSEHYYDDCRLDINESLCFVLISNLLNNAIRHNIEGGSITINITNQDIEVINSGKPLQQKPENLFRRFKKDSTSAESSGLGLALVKKICDFYLFDLNYTYYNGNHKISISFSS